jgi:CBS domain containing-hemolysin-like protein
MIHSVLPFLVIVVLIGVNGLFVAAEFAIIGVPRVAIERRAAEGSRIARTVRQIISTPRLQDRYIATAQIGITFASLGLGMYGEHQLAHVLEEHLDALGAGRWIAAHALATLVAVGVLTYFHIVVGEMVPKSIALSRAEQAVLWVTPPMLWARTALYPLVVVLNGIGTGVLRLMGIRRQTTGTEHYYSTEELQLVVEESQAGGLLREESGRLLRELFEFGELTAGEAMTPRVAVIGIPLGATPEQLTTLVQASRHTRYPAYDRDLDHIVGVVHIKDVLRRLRTGGPLVEADTHPAPYLPESATLNAVLAAMRRERTHLAVILDEHGGTAGVVTIEDLFEEVVGEVEEGTGGTAPISRDAQGNLHVAGTVRLDEVGDQFGRELEHEDVDTVSGLVLALLGRPPVVGDRVSYEGFHFVVTGVEGRGVRWCTVTMDDGSSAQQAHET